MQGKQIEIVNNFGYALAKYFQQTDDIKTLENLENSDRYSFGNIMRVIIKDQIENGEKEFLFSFDDFANLLLIENSLEWVEIRNLLLIKIYEVLESSRYNLCSQNKRGEILRK